jgi:phosphate transport system permease protein
MSQAPDLPPAGRRPGLIVSPAHERRRAIIDRLFRYVGFGATFFGLAMLLLFLLDLGIDVAAYFRTMPAAIEERNREIKERAANAQQHFDREMADLDRQLAAHLARADTEARKQEIRELFEKEIRPRRKKDLELMFQDYEKDLAHIRTDTGSGALLEHFLTAGPSNHPEDAGILPALLGSIYLGLITIVFAVPLGVGAALYLEEYSAHNWLAKIIQVNINNLAGVPSIVFGILGAYIFVELIFKPLESPTIAARNLLGGGMTLALLTLPVVIVAAQEAIRAVPVSIRHGAYALGATKWQTTWTVVLPCALPGILTGTILAMARAMGEAAPLIFFGALLFVNQDPSLFSRFTILPMQIFGWADRPEPQWQCNAALASVILLLTLLLLNAVAIFIRQRAQGKIRW